MRLAGWVVAIAWAVMWATDLAGLQANPHGAGMLLVGLTIVIGMTWVPVAAVLTLLRASYSVTTSRVEWALLVANIIMVGAFVVSTSGP